MLATTIGSTLIGIDASKVEVETELTNGLPTFNIIGMGDKSIQEAKFRIQAAFRSSNIKLPLKKTTINLAPAELRKDGSGLDLPMALGLLAANQIISTDKIHNTIAIGELGLSGQIRPVRGILAAAILTRKLGKNFLIVPAENYAEASIFTDITTVACGHLLELLDFVNHDFMLKPQTKKYINYRTNETKGKYLPSSKPQLDLSQVKGQALARRALEIAATGEHNVLLIGPPGSGKTMLAERLPTILPDLNKNEQIAVTQIWSAAGHTLQNQKLIQQRTFRAPHHTITRAGLVGGGLPIRPGEVSLAHHGVLFLDEMPELSRSVIETLRVIIENRSVNLARARQNIKLPASFMLVGAANPCPCGWAGHSSGRCVCSQEEVKRYLSRISGALMDRIELVVEVPALSADELLDSTTAETSEVIKNRVIEGRRYQKERKAHTHGTNYSDLTNNSARKLLARAIERWNISARGLQKLLGVARSIADLTKSTIVTDEHIGEALRYRRPYHWKQ